MNIQRLHKKPIKMNRVKTTIEKGVIVRKNIIVDSRGNEYDNKGNVIKHARPMHNFPPHFHIEYSNQQYSDGMDIFIIFCSYFLGILIGIYIGKQLSKTREKNIKCHCSH